MTHTPEQMATFRAQLREGLALVPIDMSRMAWGYRRDKQADLEGTPEPIRMPSSVDTRPLGITRTDYEQLRGQVNWLQDKIIEMQDEKKKGKDDYEPF